MMIYTSHQRTKGSIQAVVPVHIDRLNLAILCYTPDSGTALSPYYSYNSTDCSSCIYCDCVWRLCYLYIRCGL